MDDQSLKMNEGNKVKFRSQDDDLSYIHSSEANQLDIVSATIELSAPEDNVTVNVDGALKALKKKMQREGIWREMKRVRSYEKPSERRVRKKAEAIRRTRKLERKRIQVEGF